MIKYIYISLIKLKIDYPSKYNPFLNAATTPIKNPLHPHPPPHYPPTNPPNHPNNNPNPKHNNPLKYPPKIQSILI